jgi:SH3-like domain-containing protein
MPVDAVVSEPDWVRVRDSSGEFSWVEKKALSEKRMVVVNTPAGSLATVRADADEAAPIVFQAYPGVLLEWLDAAKPGWTHVRHRDGQSGYVQVTEVWGE